MCLMEIGDKGFFYYLCSGFEIVGIVEVCVILYFDSIIDDLWWDCVDICVIEVLLIFVLLDVIKVIFVFVDMVLVKNLCFLV